MFIATKFFLQTIGYITILLKDNIMKDEDDEIRIDSYLLNHDYDEQPDYQGDEDYEDDPYGIFGKQD